MGKPLTHTIPVQREVTQLDIHRHVLSESVAQSELEDTLPLSESVSGTVVIEVAADKTLELTDMTVESSDVSESEELGLLPPDI